MTRIDGAGPRGPATTCTVSSGCPFCAGVSTVRVVEGEVASVMHSVPACDAARADWFRYGRRVLRWERHRYFGQAHAAYLASLGRAPEGYTTESVEVGCDAVTEVCARISARGGEA